MNRYMSKKMYVIITIILFFIEILMVYLVINSFLNNDYISPNDITFYEYLVNRFEKLI